LSVGLNAVKTLNTVLDNDDFEATRRALENPLLNLPPVIDHSQSLYHEELRSMKVEKQVTTTDFLQVSHNLEAPDTKDCVLI